MAFNSRNFTLVKTLWFSSFYRRKKLLKVGWVSKVTQAANPSFPDLEPVSFTLSALGFLAPSILCWHHDGPATVRGSITPHPSSETRTLLLCAFRAGWPPLTTQSRRELAGPSPADGEDREQTQELD